MNDSTQFRTVLRGYEPAQVDHAVHELTQAVEAARREAAERTVEVSKLHSATAELQRRADGHAARVAGLEEAQRKAAAPTYRDLGDRIGSILTLADEEADLIRGDAHEQAAQLRQAATTDAQGTTSGADRYAEEVKTRADADATRVLEDARRNADSILDDADREASARREEAEAVFENQRAKAASAAADFEMTLAQRRDQAASSFAAAMAGHEQALGAAQERARTLSAESERAHADAKSEAAGALEAARSEAAALVAGAREQADRIRRDSERELAAATARRDSITSQLTNVRQMLATLGGTAMMNPLVDLHPAEVAEPAVEAHPEGESGEDPEASAHDGATTGADQPQAGGPAATAEGEPDDEHEREQAATTR